MTSIKLSDELRGELRSWAAVQRRPSTDVIRAALSAIATDPVGAFVEAGRHSEASQGGSSVPIALVDRDLWRAASAALYTQFGTAVRTAPIVRGMVVARVRADLATPVERVPVR